MAARLFRYVALGDSTSVGVGAGSDGGYPERLARKIKASGVPIGILNLAVSGATAADVAAGQLQRATRGAPDLVTLGIGTNDAWRLVPEDRFVRDLRQIADGLEQTGARVVVCNLADLGLSPAAAAAQAWVGVTPAQLSARIRLLNRHLDALAARPRFEVADLFTESQRELPRHPEYFAADGFHPSAKGYDHWADLLWPAVFRLTAGRRAPAA
jgi:lysophospholipase L1-like esterase